MRNKVLDVIRQGNAGLGPGAVLASWAWENSIEITRLLRSGIIVINKDDARFVPRVVICYKETKHAQDKTGENGG